MPEHKPMVRLKDIVSKLRKLEHVLPDPCVETFSTGKTCMMPPRQCQFIRCKIDTDCYRQSYIPVGKTFRKQVLDEDSDITGSEEFVEALKLFVKSMDGIDARTKGMVCEAPPGLSLKKSFQSNVTYFLSNYFKDPSLFEMQRGLLLSRWSTCGVPSSIL